MIKKRSMNSFLKFSLFLFLVSHSTSNSTSDASYEKSVQMLDRGKVYQQDHNVEETSDICSSYSV